MTLSNGSGPGAGAAPAGPARRGGPPPVFFLLGAGGTLLGALIVIAQLLGAAGGEPGSSARPVPATIAPAGVDAERTRNLVAAALVDQGLQVVDPQTAYRPGESPSLVLVPRRVLQVVLPDAPAGGYIVIYELPGAADADAVGRDFRAYLASGTGAIQYPRDTEFVLRRVGATLVFYPYSAEAATDEREATIADVLQGIGEPLTTP